VAVLKELGAININDLALHIPQRAPYLEINA
jgi:hypothetical protein